MFDKIKKVIDDYKAVMRERSEVFELERAERKEQFNQIERRSNSSKKSL